MMRVAQPFRQSQSGLSLIEVMVALVLSLVVSFAIFSTLIASQQQTKNTSAVNSRNQAGAYAAYQLDQLVRNAGAGLLDYSGIVTGVSAPVSGCLLYAAKNGQRLLPASSLSAPFSSFPSQVRAAPLLIHNGSGTTSDILFMMTTGGVLSSMPSVFTNTATATSLPVHSSINYRANDLLLLVGNTLQPCMVSQVQTGFVAAETTNNVPLSGDYAHSTIAGVGVSAAQSYAVDIGKTPKLLLLGVSDTDHYLYQYDLLQPQANTVSNANPSLFIENVYSMQAIYGVDVNGDGDLADLAWVQPTGAYAYTSLTNDPAAIQRIKAVKIALVLRADARDTEVVANNDVTIFADTSVAQTITLGDTHYRYRAFEITVPIRNSML